MGLDAPSRLVFGERVTVKGSGLGRADLAKNQAKTELMIGYIDSWSINCSALAIRSGAMPQHAPLPPAPSV
jgi:hypothetical protein